MSFSKMIEFLQEKDKGKIIIRKIKEPNIYLINEIDQFVKNKWRGNKGGLNRDKIVLV